MFKNRVLTVTVDKKDKEPTESSSESFDEKTATIVVNLERLATKMFLGVCIYIWLDTRRQVQIEQAKHPR